MGGRQPIAGTTVTVWAANPTPGAAAAEFGHATTDGDGHFSVAFTSTPADGQTVYVIARGGDAGAGSGNDAIALMTIAGGYCEAGTAGCGFPASVTLNELTTTAAAYSLAAFISENTGGINVSGAAPGLANAALNFAALVDAASGEATFQAASECIGNGEPVNCGALRRLNLLADYAAACVNAGAETAACTGLLQQTAAADTLAALHHLAAEPAVRNDGAGLFALGAPPSTYAPVLDSAPAAWVLALVHTGGGLSGPAGLAVDAAGNVWIANNINVSGAGSVTKLGPTGAALSPDGGFTGGGLDEPVGLAVDLDGNVWVANFAQGGGTSVSELAAGGVPLSPDAGFIGGGILGAIAVAVTSTNQIWVANAGNSTLTRLDSAGIPDLTVSGGGLAFPVALAIDAAGNLWVADQGSDAVSELDAAGNAISGAGGYTGGDIAGPNDLALDVDGNVWVANHFSGATGLTGGSKPPASCTLPPASGDTGCPFSPAGGYTGGGLNAPGSVAVDGAGNVWFADYLFGSISELSSGGAALSPSAGYTAGGLATPYDLAVDASGNLWITNFNGDSVTEYIGIAVPVKTPLIGPPAAP